MCGINGLWDFKRNLDGKALIIKMNNSLIHRGPDYGSNLTLNNLHLGHRRLSIIDIDPRSNQPFSNENYVIVFNGEIYNYQEIKKRIPEYNFITNSDTEVIIAAFQKWGLDCLQHFNGMFAFSIYDKQKEELFIARDRMGIKPFYYTLTDNYFIFSSEIKGILSTDLVKKEINSNALNQYIRYQTCNSPSTLINNVFSLEKGSYMLINKNGLITKKVYWKINETINTSNYDNIKADVKKLFFKAVENRLVADVNVGAFLSGGIDSSAVVAAMSNLSSNNISTFSVNFAEKEYDESKYAEIIAKKYNTNHTSIQLNPTDFLNEIPTALNFMDHPSGDGLNTYVVSKYVKKENLSVALSGLGGDELFAGYPLFNQLQKLSKIESFLKLPKGLKKTIAKTYLGNKSDIASLKTLDLISNSKGDLSTNYSYTRLMLDSSSSKSILNKEYYTSNELNLKYNNKIPFISNISQFEFDTYLENTLLRDTDQFSMAHALEVRVPFLDHNLVEYVLNIPDKYKTNKQIPKQLIVDSMGDLLPKEIIYRKKMGFVMPWEIWMKNELKSFCEEKLKNLKDRQYFNAIFIEEIWSSFLANENKFNWSRIWYLVTLSNWLDKYEIE